MSDKERAFKKTLEALGKTEYGKKGRQLASKSLSDLGITKKEMAALGALLKAAHDKELEYEFKSGNWKVTPKISEEDQSIGIHWTHPIDW